jgi:hypothetical protein
MEGKKIKKPYYYFPDIPKGFVAGPCHWDTIQVNIHNLIISVMQLDVQILI